MPTTVTHHVHRENQIDCYISDGGDRPYRYDVTRSNLSTCDQQVYCHLSKDKGENKFPPTAFEVQQFKDSMPSKGICQKLPPEFNKCKTCSCPVAMKKVKRRRLFGKDYKIPIWNSFYKSEYETGVKSDSPCREEACNYIMHHCRSNSNTVSKFKTCINKRNCNWDDVRARRGWSDNELIHGKKMPNDPEVIPQRAGDDDIFKGFGPKYETCLFGLHEASGTCATFWGSQGMGPPNKTAAWA